MMSNYTLQLIFRGEKKWLLEESVCEMVWFVKHTLQLTWWENSAGGTIISVASQQTSNMGISLQLTVVWDFSFVY